MHKLKRLFAVAMLSSVATFAFADDAPVYDADNYPPQFDGQSDSGSGADNGNVQTGTTQQIGNIQTSTVQTHPAPAPVDVTAPALSKDQRLSQIEQQITNLQRSNNSAQIDALKSDVQSLRGQVDDLTHQLQQLQTQQRSQYADLDKRLSKQAAAPAPKPSKSVISVEASNTTDTTTEVADTTTTDSNAVKSTPDDVIPVSKTKVAKSVAKTKTPAVASEQPNPAEEQQIYQTAYNLIKAKKYNEAVAALQKMLQKYPSGQFAANAHYWLGELYNLMGNNEQSAVEFSTVVRNYPDSPKVSDAQLKLGLIYAAAFKWPDAKAAFKKVINRYPGTGSARLAAEQLKQIKDSGH